MTIPRICWKRGLALILIHSQVWILLNSYWCVSSREWMGMGVAGIIITIMDNFLIPDLKHQWEFASDVLTETWQFNVTIGRLCTAQPFQGLGWFRYYNKLQYMLYIMYSKLSQNCGSQGRATCLFHANHLLPFCSQVESCEKPQGLLRIGEFRTNTVNKARWNQTGRPGKPWTSLDG